MIRRPPRSTRTDTRFPYTTLFLSPTLNLSFSSNIAYNDARLSTLLPDSFAPGGGYAKGTRLPGASEWTLSNSLDLSFADAPLKPRFGLAHRSLSRAPVDFAGTLEKGDFHLVDPNASITVHRRIELGSFANKLSNQ